tara:strand:+ start:365 stop:2128 length:1764 start_codon:yes stop_codon:yes gene_type:complete
MAIELILNGDNSSEIKELHDLEILASVEEGNVNARITTEQITLVNNYAKLVRDYIAGGANGTTEGIFEGLPLQIQENGVNVFDGYLDFLNDFEIVDPTTVKSRIKKHDGNNNFQDRANGLTFGYLEQLNLIGTNDYLSIPYIIEKEFNFIEFSFIAFSIYAISRDLQTQIRIVSQQAANIAHLAAMVPPQPLSALAFAGLQLALNIVFAGVLVSILINLLTDLVRYIFSPIKYHKGIKLQRLVEIGCSYLGYSYNSTIIDLPGVCIIPTKTGIDKDTQQNELINGIQIDQPGVGYPSASDFGYTLGEVFELINKIFYAEFTIKNGVVEQHVIDSSWWLQNSTYVLPDIFQESIVTNANELISDKLITFKTDVKDINSFENFLGHTYEIRTRPISISDNRNVLMNGFNRIDIPYDLPNRKNKLNNFENFAFNLLDKVEQIIDVFYAINPVASAPNLTGFISQRIGCNILETDYLHVPKIMKLDSNLRLPANQRTLWSAKYLYNLYHSKGSFVLNNFGNQYYIYKGVRVPFGFEEFNQLTQNSYFYNQNGDLCKLEQISWNVSQDFAIIDYRVKTKYTTNLIEEYIEEA